MPRQSWDSLRDWNPLTLSPTPARGKKKRQSWVCSGARAGQDLERIPLFWGCWTSRFWKIYIKSDKSSVIRRPGLCFQTNAKTNKQTLMPIPGPQTTSLMATVCSALDLGHLLNLGWAKSENKLQGSSYLFSKLQLFMQHPEESSEVVQNDNLSL